MNGVIDLNVDKFIYEYTGINIIHLDTFDTTDFTQRILNFKHAMQPYLVENGL